MVTVIVNTAVWVGVVGIVFLVLAALMSATSFLLTIMMLIGIGIAFFAAHGILSD